MIFVRKGEDPPWIVAGSLWERIEPLLPKAERRSHYPGRRRLDDRKVLGGILFVLHTESRWEFLPKEPGFGSGMTCWRRLVEWHEASVWDRLHLATTHLLILLGALTPAARSRTAAAPTWRPPTRRPPRWRAWTT